ncbi:MAG: hypothetical protein EA425_01060 [Puniceicoccaceae bacterium]|nr:MAG: hypothetical protein EA425_01060 [Puniceicoccaceae bacterium]
MTAAERKRCGAIATRRMRCLAMVAGSRHIRMLLADGRSGFLRIEHALRVDLEEEGVISLEETRAYLRKITVDFGDAPVALVLPQEKVSSQVMELRRRDRRGVEEALYEAEERLGSDREENLISLHSLQAKSGAKNSAWVTVVREAAVEDELYRLGQEGGRVEAVQTPAACLVNAFLALYPDERDAILIDVRRTVTTLVIVRQRQAVHAAPLGVGEDVFSEAVMADRDCSFEEAEHWRMEADRLQDWSDTPRLQRAVAHFSEACRQALADWAAESGCPEEELGQAPCWLAGDVASMPGFARVLEEDLKRPVRLWPSLESEVGKVPLGHYAVALGGILGVLQPRPAFRETLLPRSVRDRMVARRRLRLVHAACLGLLAACGLLLTTILVQQHHHQQDLRRELQRLEVAVGQIAGVDQMLVERSRAYWETLPYILQQKRNRDLVLALNAMAAIGEREDVWVLLLADRRSYLEGAPPFRSVAAGREREVLLLHNLVAAQTGMVAELGLPETLGDAITPIGEVVSHLRGTEPFSTVDIMPGNGRQLQIDPELTARQRIFALTLDVTTLEPTVAPPSPRARNSTPSLRFP